MHMTITNHDKIELFEYSQNISSRLKCNQISTTKCVSWNEWHTKLCKQAPTNTAFSCVGCKASI